MKNLILKLLDKKKYRDIKNENKKKKKLEFYYSNINEKILENFEVIKRKKELNFSHSGHLGDLVYSLATIKSLSKDHKCNLFIKANKKMPIKYFNHPSGEVYLDERLINLFLPLVKSQRYLNNVKIYDDEKIDIDLDLFREIPIDIKFHSIRWYMHLTGVQFDMSSQFLDIENHKSITNNIVIVRSPRYRNDFINYNFLDNIKDKIICVGLKSEFEDLKKSITHLEYYNCKDFLELAQIIKACKLFIGNECFAYSVAEGLKIPRLLEASPDFPVVFPVGDKAYDFYHQIHFEEFFKKLYKDI